MSAWEPLAPPAPPAPLSPNCSVRMASAMGSADAPRLGAAAALEAAAAPDALHGQVARGGLESRGRPMHDACKPPGSTHNASSSTAWQGHCSGSPGGAALRLLGLDHVNHVVVLQACSRMQQEASIMSSAQQVLHACNQMPCLAAFFTSATREACPSSAALAPAAANCPP